MISYGCFPKSSNTWLADDSGFVVSPL